MPRENNEHFLFGVIIYGEGSPTFSKISESADASEPFLDKDEFDSKDTQKSHERILLFHYLLFIYFCFLVHAFFLWLFLTHGYLMCLRAPCRVRRVASQQKNK